ncbi:ATP-binding protein [Brunnivagina elsteri]|uniref:histidine kinase n=1 Tax=Brunnivagina elsteri CCALA 953 TaxID=987040 RepID=A0A2A2TLD5_9CYAN|nr:ATP-binding protein [Calothrix elsteri]PAX58411.1 cyanobacterial phytochrome A [Calothrix elsteri CCALA 953]
MKKHEFIIAENLDLTNCDREPIHIPGSIQSHGLLFVLQEPEFKILQVSKNTYELIGYDYEDLLNQPLTKFLSEEQINAIAQCLDGDFECVNPLKLSIQVEENLLYFDGIVHRDREMVILELEPTDNREYINFLKFYHLINSTVSKLQNAPTLQKMCQIVVKKVRKLTGFERVMVYKFDEDGTGCVIAEEKRDDLSPYLQLCYPHSDIPKQARQLYSCNWLRIIPDVNYEPIEIVPALNPLTNTTVDLSFSVLRSVSPIHIEYLKNMRVTASMSISIMKNKKLWGLIACHHSSPQYLSYEIRTACEFLGKIISSELVDKEANEDFDYKMKLRFIQGKFIESISQAESFMTALAESGSNLLEIVNATGAFICLEHQHIIIGNTPEISDLHKLLAWIENQTQDNIFSTNILPKVYPQAEEFKDVGSGLLALTISRIHRNYILWFRAEVIRTVNWGGNPNKPVETIENGASRLVPRKSFEMWQETVKNSSLPWKDYEIEAVTELRSAIVNIVLRRADELAKINIELERSNSELDTFAYIASHDLKEPLRGIYNYSSFLMEDYADVLDEDGLSKLKTLLRLTQKMENLIESLLHFSRLGRAELSRQRINLNELLQGVIDVININYQQSFVDIIIPRSLPEIIGDRIQINELFTNLITNAIKYNDKANKRVEIGFIDADETSQDDSQQFKVFYVKDNGIGIPEKHYDTVFRIFKRLHGQKEYSGGTGAGLTIAKKIVERHGGKISIESIVEEGTTFFLSLPI